MQMIIDGVHVDASDKKTIDVFNSATMEFITTIPNATAEDVNRAIEAAQAGQAAWGELPQYKRSEILQKCAFAIEANLKELSESLTGEMGKIISEARPEVAVAAQIFRGYAEMANHRYGRTMSEYQNGSETDMIFTMHEPRGVVACITPFNYPVELCSQKMAAALAVGNSVIVKPATDNPLTLIKVVELCHEAGVPGNVLQIVTGRGSAIGDMLSKDPRIDAISLTGSTEVGVSIMKNAAESMKAVFLELGGNDPFIVFEDADMELAVREAAGGRLKNAGQTCCSPKRFIVQNSVKAEFIAGVKAYFENLKLGSPFDETVELGSLISENAAKKVKNQVDSTIALGAKLVCGGNIYDRTYFEPTILDEVTLDMPIATSMECFGPVMPVLGFDTFEEAIEIANATPYGLQSGVMSRDMALAMRAASKIKAGAVVINGSGNYRNCDQPFGGVKMSGLGREGICCTLDEMTQEKSYVLKNVLK